MQQSPARLSRRYLAGILAAIGVLIGLSYGEELAALPARRPDRSTLRLVYRSVAGDR